MKRLLQYIIGSDGQPGLKPHKVKDAISVNRARRIVEDFVPAIVENAINNLITYTEQLKEIQQHGNQQRSVIKYPTNETTKIEKILCKKCEKNGAICDITDKTEFKYR